MKSNGTDDTPSFAANEASRNLSYVPWETTLPAEHLGVLFQASGDAHPQVRSPEKLARLGQLDAQVHHIQQVTVQSLRDILLVTEATGEQLEDLRGEIASATLVSANMKLAEHGVALLDLTIHSMSRV